jgi:hypothetical protein
MSFILGQKITDTLCGTKALYKKDFLNMKMGRDKWGDFDLLLGAANLKSKIAEVPIHYKMRKSGKSKMKALKHGFNFLTVCFRGFIELVLAR